MNEKIIQIFVDETNIFGLSDKRVTYIVQDFDTGRPWWKLHIPPVGKRLPEKKDETT